MLRHAILAFFALLVCSEALAVTLVPVPLTSTSQTIQVDGVRTTDPTDALANSSSSNGTASAEAKVADGVLTLSYSATGTSAAGGSGLHRLEFNVPDFGSATTPVVFMLSLSSQASFSLLEVGQNIGAAVPFVAQGYTSSILGTTSTLPNPISLGFMRLPVSFPTSNTFSSVVDFLAGDTVHLDLVSSANGAGTATLQAFAVEPTPEPSTSLLVGAGLVVLGFRSRRNAH